MKDTEKFDLNDKELKETPEKIKKFRELIENTTKKKQNFKMKKVNLPHVKDSSIYLMKTVFLKYTLW